MHELGSLKELLALFERRGSEEGTSAVTVWSRPAPCVWRNGTELSPRKRVFANLCGIRIRLTVVVHSCMLARACAQRGNVLVARASVIVSATRSQLTDESIVCLRVRLSRVRTQTQHLRAFSAVSQRKCGARSRTSRERERVRLERARRLHLTRSYAFA